MEAISIGNLGCDTLSEEYMRMLGQLLNKDGCSHHVYRRQETCAPKERWTDSDMATSKFNSKALTTIFSAVDLNQLKIF